MVRPAKHHRLLRRTAGSPTPSGSTALASNSASEIQAIEIATAGSSFLGLQYHLEHTFATTAAIMQARIDRLVEEGFARSLLQAVIADLRALETDPSRRDIAWRLGF